MIVLLPLLVALIGGVMWIVAVNPKWSYLGLVSFGIGLHAFLLASGEQVVTLFSR